MRKLRILVGLLAVTGAGFASTVECGTSLSNVAACSGASLFTPSATLDWGSAFGTAVISGSNPFNPPAAATLPNSLGTVDISLTSLGPGNTTLPGQVVVPYPQADQLQRVDNAAFLWNSNSGGFWDSPSDVVPGLSYYGGHFGDDNSPTNSSDGDNLLGMTASGSGGQLGVAAPMTLTFPQAVSGVEFRISSISGTNTDTNFIAELDAYNSSGLIGDEVISASGLGGLCSTLLNPQTNGFDPVACDDAPYIGFAAAGITKVVVYAYDTGTSSQPLVTQQGFLIDSLRVNPTGSQGPTIPEPGDALLMLSGLAVLAGCPNQIRRRIAGLCRS